MMDVLQIRAVVVLFYALLTYVASQREGDVRLEGSNSTRGRLEIFFEGTWTNICYNYNNSDSQVTLGRIVCRQLGFFDVDYVGNTTSNLPNGIKIQELSDLMRTVRCNQFVGDPDNAPRHVYRCFSPGQVCNHGDGITVICNENVQDDFPYDTMVDFLHNDPTGVSLSKGFAQVYVNQQWGPVCNMQKEDADVFCRQLSFTNAVNVMEVNAPMINFPLLDKFHCSTRTGISVACLRDCFNYPDEDAIIRCPNGNSYVTCDFISDVVDELFGHYGTNATCSSTVKTSARFSRATLGILLATVAFALATGLVYFFFCRKRRTAPNISRSVNYDAI